MIHVCTAANRHLYRAQLREMHRQRYEIFVKSKGWNLTVKEGGEFDEGDDARAVYLMAIDENGSCYSSIRVRPADDFSMIIDRMAHYVEGDASALRNEPGLWEMARWISIGADPAVAQELRIGLIEYLLDRGATQCLAIADIEVMAYAIRTGWRLRVLGPPKPYPEGGVAIALSLPIRREEASYLRDLTDRHDVFMMEIDPGAPWAGLPLPLIQSVFQAAAASARDADEMTALADQELRHRIDIGRVA